MSFRAENVNDLLKSMVVEDLGGGTVPAASYASRDPITKTLGTFAIDRTDDPSIGQILGRLRGERIEAEAAPPATGTIVGDEKRQVPVGDDRSVEKEFITILTADGLRTLPLDAITRIRLLDEKLQQELEQAITVLALGHDSEKKSVSLAFAGRASGPSAWATCRSRRSGRRATGWCWGAMMRRASSRLTRLCCRAGRSSRTRPTATARTCGWRWRAAGRSRS